MRTLAVLAVLLVTSASATTTPDPAQDVNPFTGTDAKAADFGTGGGAGNTFPGAVAPFGMIQWSPDTVPANVAYAGGYSYPDGQLRGFSLTHLSGAGCGIFWDVPILPTTVPVTTSPSVAGTYDIAPDYLPSFTHADEQAEPGFYRVRLDPGTPRAIEVELAARTRSAVGRFTYPASTSASLLFNAGGSAMANGDVAIRIDPGQEEVSGSVEAGQFCYHRNRYTLHFVVRFERPFTAHGTWTGGTLSPASVAVTEHAEGPFQLRNVPGFPAVPHGSTGVQAGHG